MKMIEEIVGWRNVIILVFMIIIMIPRATEGFLAALQPQLAEALDPNPIRSLPIGWCRGKTGRWEGGDFLGRFMILEVIILLDECA